MLTISEKKNEEVGDIDRGAQASYCSRCGEKIDPGTKFCPKCGKALGVAVGPTVTGRVERRPSEVPHVLGFISAGVILVLLASTYILYPIEVSVIAVYFQTMADQKIFIKPPSVLIEAAIFFFNAAGAWGIILSILRVVLERRPREALGDMIGGLFSFYVAFLLSNYATDILTARVTLAFFIVGIGLLVVINALVHFAFQEKR